MHLHAVLLMYFVHANMYILKTPYLEYWHTFYVHFCLYSVDTNECQSNGGLGPCDQICTNTIGSFYCSCNIGYALSASGLSCDGKRYAILLLRYLSNVASPDICREVVPAYASF